MSAYQLNLPLLEFNGGRESNQPGHVMLFFFFQPWCCLSYGISKVQTKSGFEKGTVS